MEQVLVKYVKLSFKQSKYNRVSTRPGNPGNVLEFVSVLEFFLETS